jgi:hypothetical protein
VHGSEINRPSGGKGKEIASEVSTSTNAPVGISSICGLGMSAFGLRIRELALALVHGEDILAIWGAKVRYCFCLGSIVGKRTFCLSTWSLHCIPRRCAGRIVGDVIANFTRHLSKRSISVAGRRTDPYLFTFSRVKASVQ